jgi:DNA-binding protein HU-beta
MNKSDLIGEVAETTGYTRAEVTRLVGLVFGGVTGGLARGEEVSISGFGIFRCRERRATIGRNPRTGEEIHIAAQRSAALRPAKALRRALNPAAGPEQAEAAAPALRRQA